MSLAPSSSSKPLPRSKHSLKYAILAGSVPDSGSSLVLTPVSNSPSTTSPQRPSSPTTETMAADSTQDAGIVTADIQETKQEASSPPQQQQQSEGGASSATASPAGKAEAKTPKSPEIAAKTTTNTTTSEQLKNKKKKKLTQLAAKAKAQQKKKKKKGKKIVVEESSESSSDSSSSDSSSDSSDSEDDESTESESESSSEEDKKAKKKRKQRQKRKAAKAKAKAKKHKSKRRNSSTDETSTLEDSSDSSDSESSVDEKARKKLKARKRRDRKRKSHHREDEEEEDEDHYDDEDETEDATTGNEALQLLAELARENLSQGLPPPSRSRTVPKIVNGSRTNRRRDRGEPPVESRSRRTRSEGKRKAKKRGSKAAFKRVDQLWDNSIHNYKLTETVDDPDADEFDQYIFTVRRKFDWENKYTDTLVDIKSKALKEVLQHIMEGVKSVSLVQDTPHVDPNMLFLYLEECRDYIKELKSLAKTEPKKKARKTAATKAAHLKVLVKYLDKDYAETKKTLYPLLENSTITFDLLWALFKPNTIAYCPTYGNADEPRAFKIEYANKESSFMKGQWYEIEGRYLEYDGKSFGMGTMSTEVESFKGPRKITSLGCYPFQYHKDQEALRAKLIERGRKFVALKGMNYRFHKGMAFYKKKRSVIKVNINGRVMVDPAIHRRINPNYPISTVKPKDPDLLSEYGGSDDDSCGCCGSESDSEGGGNQAGIDNDDEPKTRLKLVKDDRGKPQLVQVEVDETGNEIQRESIDKLDQEDGDKDDEKKTDPSLSFTEEDLLIASPVVLGFAFSEKLWLEFTVSGISPIEWNRGAFDSLVLPGNQKSIVKALVESHTFHAAENIDDVIQGKGRGLVAVLHGPPGTGKTLTAEGIAELLQRPLYMVSVGELGTDARTLEAELNKILDIAHSWGAVLLLDEADVFLEKRTIQDIHRNALVSIFLRLLEYFQGILFLTTNRVETFDDAFQSRIHVALRYGELTVKAKKAVWKMFVEKVRALGGVVVREFSEGEYDELARCQLNGRQIKNSVRTAQALAVNEKVPLSMAHIKRVLQVAESFDQDLKGGSGYLDAMRSYT